MTALAIVNGAALVVLVAVTTYYAWQTGQMVTEMRETRLLSLLPKLVLDVKMVGPTFGVVVVRNVGPGPAMDADLTIILEAAEGSSNRDERRWIAHLIASGEEHEFLPGQEISSMDDLVRKHPAIALSGTMKDALGVTHEVDETIDIAGAWSLIPDALHGWRQADTRKISNELEKVRKSVEKIEHRLRTLAFVAEGEARRDETT